MTFARFEGGGRRVAALAIVGAVGLVLTLLGGLADARAALHSYLFAFVFWATLAAAALLWLGVFHATGARWPVLVRRPLEAMAETSLLFVALFLPLALGARRVYLWAAPSPAIGEEKLALLARKAAWLDPGFFGLRGVVYLAAWAVCAFLLGRWSRAQDESGALLLTVRQRRLGAGMLPLVGITFTGASFDWLMSLDPFWVSTVFGIYVFAGSFLAALCALYLAAVLTRAPGSFGAALSPAHFHSMGKLVLGFVSFWGYIAFSQAMLIWIGNLPEEVEFLAHRTQHGWQWIGLSLVVGHFFVPFAILLSRSVKTARGPMGAICAWLLLMHLVDLYWLVMPALSPLSPAPRWTDLTALLGVGGAAVAFALWRLKGGYTVPVRDPYLAAALELRP